MQDRELYQRIGEAIAPWTVRDITVESAALRLEVQVECHDPAPKQCPHCDCMLLVCDFGKEQIWRRPDTGLWQIFLKGRPPLVECPEHGVVRVAPPWADWYVRGPDKSLQGPWSLEQLKLLLDVGRISPSTLLKRSGSNKWVITGTVHALFVRQDETLEPSLSADELAAVDWAIASGPALSMSIERAAFIAPTALDRIATGGNASVGDPRSHSANSHSEDYRTGDIPKRPRRDRQTTEPPVTGVTPAGKEAKPGPPEFNLDSGGLGDSDRPLTLAHSPKDGDERTTSADAVRDSRSNIKPAHPSVPREPEKRPARRGEQSPADWTKALEQAVKMEHTATVVRVKPAEEAAPQDVEAAAQVVKAATRRDALVRRRGFQDGYQLLTIVYLINACLVCFLVSVVCTIFFSRLLLLTTSVFAPFEGGNALQGGQLVECGLSALTLLVLIGFPLWHLISNGGILWHYVPSTLLGMTVGFGLSPDYLDEVCAALQWCQFAFGIATVGLTVHTLFAVPKQSRMSPPMIAAGLLTVLSALVLCCVRSGSMLSVQADAVPPQFRGALPDAALYVFGLYGTLVFIPGAILFELYGHTDFSSRQFIIRTGIMLGVYVLAGVATLGTFVHGAGSGFFDVPLALVPLGCINALAAAIPSVLLLVDPQFSVSQD